MGDRPTLSLPSSSVPPGISVVIPTKDRKDSLLRVLPSYLSQPEVTEVIVVINASTDGTQKVLAELAVNEPRLRVFDNEVNRGLCFSQNRGVAESRCELIFIGEDDVELTPGFFALLESHRQALGVQFICGRNVWRIDGEGAEQALERASELVGPYVNLKTLQIETGFALPDDSFQKMLAAPTLGEAAAFRDVPFDEGFRVNSYREETDFQISAQEKGYKLGYCPHAICFNEIYTQDRGGIHSAHGIRWTFWVARNNWRFITKHPEFLREHFEIGNKYAYFCKVAAMTFWSDQAVPMLISTRKVLRQVGNRPRSETRR